MKDDGKTQSRMPVKSGKTIQRPPDKKTPMTKAEPFAFVAPALKLLARLLTVIPAPRITSPTSGAAVAPGAALDVSIETNVPDLPHELLLYQATNTTSPLAFTEIPDPAAGPFQIGIPADPGGLPTDYFLELGIPPGFAEEQQRHRIEITTVPPVLSVSAVSGNPPPGKYSIGSGLTVDFNVSAYGTDGLSTFTWDFGDSGTASTKAASHTYTTTGTIWVSVTVKAGSQEETGTIGPYEFTT
ncbi:MAG TPA: PKD domain-containing protein [Gemmataceae bacterium]|nr:PKD domain-containing protein [Gemmataceae bacterium]